MSAPGNSPPVEANNSPPVEGWQAKLDGVVVPCLHQAIPLLWRQTIPLLWRGGKRSLTGWLYRVCTRQFPSCGGKMTSTDTLLQSHRVRTRQFPSCGGEMTSTDTLLQSHRVRTRRLTGWCLRTHPTYENR